MIDLDPKHLELTKSILAEHFPDCDVRAFGSRVTGKARVYSDLDVMITGDGALDRRSIEALKDAFSESDLPIMVDIVDGNAISESFRRIIESHCEVLC